MSPEIIWLAKFSSGKSSSIVEAKKKNTVFPLILGSENKIWRIEKNNDDVSANK